MLQMKHKYIYLLLLIENKKDDIIIIYRGAVIMERQYLAIHLKRSYASVECVEGDFDDISNIELLA